MRSVLWESTEEEPSSVLMSGLSSRELIKP